MLVLDFRSVLFMVCLLVRVRLLVGSVSSVELLLEMRYSIRLLVVRFCISFYM